MEKNMFDMLVNGKQQKKTKDPIRGLFGTPQPNIQGLFSASSKKDTSKDLLSMYGFTKTKKKQTLVDPFLGGMFKSTSKKPLVNPNVMSMFGTYKSQQKTKSHIDPNLMSMFKGKGHPNPLDKVTKEQSAFLKKTRMGTGKSHKRFMDKDGDGVIAGLDCKPYDPTEHGILTKAKNWMTGGGFKEDDKAAIERRRREMEKTKQEALERSRQEIKEYDETEKQVEEKSEIAAGITKEIKPHREKARELDMRAQEKRSMIASKLVDQGLDIDDFIQKTDKYKEAIEKPGIKEIKQEVDKLESERDQYKMYEAPWSEALRETRQAKKIQDDKIDDTIGSITDVAQKQKEQESYDEWAKEFKEFTKQREEQEKAKRAEEMKGKAGLHQVPGYIEEKLIDADHYRYHKDDKGKLQKKVDLRGKLSRVTGYMFETKEARDKLREDDRKRQLDKDIETIGYDRYIKIRNKELKGGDGKRKPISPDEVKEMVAQEAAKKRREKELALRKEAEQRPEDEAQRAQRIKYAQLQQTLSEANIAETLRRKRMQQQEAGGGILQFMVGQRPQSMRPGTAYVPERPYTSPFSERRTEFGEGPEVVHEYGLRPGSYEYSARGQPPKEIVSRFGFRGGYAPTVPTDPEAQKRYEEDRPKFVYKRKPGAFTRKSSRLRAGDDPKPGEVSEPSKKKRAGKRYPWTKPMQGWERIYVGKGRFGGKGRQKRSKVPEQYGTHGHVDKTGLKRKFVPHVKAYGYRP